MLGLILFYFRIATASVRTDIVLFQDCYCQCQDLYYSISGLLLPVLGLILFNYRIVSASVRTDIVLFQDCYCQC